MSHQDVLVLLSGGLDSTTLAAMAHREGRLRAVLFADYGQANRHQEDRSTYDWCKKHEVERLIFTFGGWSRLNKKKLGLHRLADALHAGVGVPGPRVMPNRNMMLLSGGIHYAASMAARRCGSALLRMTRRTTLTAARSGWLRQTCWERSGASRWLHRSLTSTSARSWSLRASLGWTSQQRGAATSQTACSLAVSAMRASFVHRP